MAMKPCKGCPTPAACKRAGQCLGKKYGKYTQEGLVGSYPRKAQAHQGRIRRTHAQARRKGCPHRKGVTRERKAKSEAKVEE